MLFGRQVRPAQTSSFSMYRPQQSGSLPMAVGAAADTGIDVSSIMGMILPLMVVGMMMKMMTGMMGGVGSPKKSAASNPGNPGVSPKKGVITKKIRGQDTIFTKGENWNWNTVYKTYNSEKTNELLRWEDLEPLQKEF